MYDNSDKQLIVLGNGFDLACGLKSSYKDFFESRFKKIAEYFECEDGEAFYRKFVRTREDITEKLENITIWDYIFISEKYSQTSDKNNWSDVETIIAAVLKYTATNSSNSILSEETKQLIDTMEREITVIDSMEREITDFSNRLLPALEEFEKNFSHYISERANSDEYLDKAALKLNKLILPSLKPKEKIKKHFFRKRKHYIENVSILSFNYTLNKEDFDNFVIEDGNITNDPHSENNLIEANSIIDQWVNIHGLATTEDSKNPPIFGIDFNEIHQLDHNSEEYKLAVPFTKTFRVALQNANIGNGFVKSLPKNVDIITFYGHSLARADFAYFESLFDMYDLYDSNLRLEFYYGSYNPTIDDGAIKFLKFMEKDRKIKRDLMENVYSLLESYGASLNDNHGENLLHRLLLEGRIAFYEDKGSFRS